MTMARTFDVDNAQQYRSSFSPLNRLFDTLVMVSSGAELDATQLNGVDWSELLRLARHHSLTPHLAHRALEANANLPSHLRADMHKEFKANLQRNFVFLNEARKILMAWRAQGIAGMPYKGPALAEQLWDSFALRECSDLDLLVRREDVDHAGRVLTRLGYRRICPVADHLRSRFLHHASEEQFQHVETGMLLELQWAPVPRTFAVRFDESQLWRNQVMLHAAGEAMPVPDPVVLLGMLVIHGWKHNWSKLIWIADVAQLIRRYDVGWSRLSAQAGRDGWRRILLLGLEMARRIYGAESPLVADAAIAKVADELASELRAGRVIDYFSWHRYMLRARDSVLAQATQLAKFALTPGLGEYSAANLPQWAGAGYRAVRLGRVISLWPEKALA